ncbi:5,10-methylenetetrahydrofolate reductase [Solibacillus sp. R5-41]|uniref:nuclease-related domain-containing protein n=1 Tax=Solibacillus sp. R5-41 TaxID=2048654 RepID=UPI000C1246E9|nr:nuclease-related domain-containing protein [Solibacillus sp. R5-41]ATP42103.1 5,10-methylenetetrahydrofolate reductase [Solibacillus sp. R5-41]
MTLLFMVVLIAILGFFAMKTYQHDNTTFYKLTGYSYLDVWTNKKVRTSHKLVGILDEVKGPHKIVVNVQLPTNEALQPIDAVFIHETGIYVINILEMSGWINGREQDLQWTQLLHKDKSKLFNNPVHETKRLNFALRDYLAEVNEEVFESLVLFSNDCSFQNIELFSENVDVIKSSAIKKWTKNLQQQRLSETDIQTIYSALEGMMQVKNNAPKVKKTVLSSN